MICATIYTLIPSNQQMSIFKHLITKMSTTDGVHSEFWSDSISVFPVQTGEELTSRGAWGGGALRMHLNVKGRVLKPSTFAEKTLLTRPFVTSMTDTQKHHPAAATPHQSCSSTLKTLIVACVEHTVL